MMKKSLSLMMFVSLAAGVAMAAPQGANEWFEQQALNEATAENAGVDVSDVFLLGLKGMAFIPGATDSIAANAELYKTYTEQAIANLKAGKSNTAVYAQISNSINFHEKQWYGKALVPQIKSSLNFNDLAIAEAKARASNNMQNVKYYRQLQFNLANRALANINKIETAIR